MRCPTTVVLAVLSTGCSFVLRGPPARPIGVDQDVRCETTSPAPVLDSVAAIVAITSGIVMVAGNAGKTCVEEPCGPKMAVGFGTALIAIGIPYAVSSAYGYRKVQQCREVIDSQLNCRDGNLAACLRLQPEVPALPDPSSSSSDSEMHWTGAR